MVALLTEVNAARTAGVGIERERGASSEGTRAAEEQGGRPLGRIISLEEKEDRDDGENPEIESSEQIIADYILRAEAKLSAKAIAR